MTILSIRHLLTFMHWPEWMGEGGLVACVRCIKGGCRVRVLHPFARPL